MKELNRTKVSDILVKAAQIVSGPRAQTHGDTTFTHAANLITAYLRPKLGGNEWIDEVDVAQIMVLFKIARTITGDRAHEDHYLDAAAYSAIAGALADNAALTSEPKSPMTTTLKETGPYGDSFTGRG